jgi:uncharacterized protein (TIGR02284 family)
MADLEPADLIRLLEELGATCRDGEEGFRQVAGEFEDPAMRERFTRYAHQRAGLASELVGEIHRLGGEPTTTGHAAGAIHRGWMRLKAALTGYDDAAILNEAERGEDVALEVYRKALACELPVETRTMLQRQRDDIEAVHREVRDLRDAALARTDRPDA